MEPTRQDVSTAVAVRSSPSREVRFRITDGQGMQYVWQVRDGFLSAVLKREVLSVSPADGAVEVSVRHLAQYVNEAERQRALAAAQATVAATAAQASEKARASVPSAQRKREASVKPAQTNQLPPPALLSESSCSASATSSSSSFCADMEDGVEDDGSVKEALSQSLLADSALFFSLASECYEMSRDPFHSRGRSRGGGGDVSTLADHCPGFRVCCVVFGEVYGRVVRPVVEQLPDLSRITTEDLLWFRKVVRDTFTLRPDDPNLSGPSESNLDSDWVDEYIKKDQYFFSQHGRRRSGKKDKASLVDITLSYVPHRKKQSGKPPPATSTTSTALMTGSAKPRGEHEEADVVAKENDVPTYYLAELLQNPSWEPDDACAQCRQCGATFKSVAWPFGARAHHCRSCGHRLCSSCISHKAHRSFAKLSKPGSGVQEPDERLVCDKCYEAYVTLERHRYLGALFAFAGLDFSDLSLCRTVSRQWRQAAELCISEYRLLLHQCEPDLSSVLTPVGVLLQNSVHLIASMAAGAPTSAGKAKHCDVGDPNTETSTPPERRGAEQSFLESFHPEPALLLLRFIQRKAQWAEPSTARLLERLVRCTPDHFGGNAFIQGTRTLPHTGGSSRDRRGRAGSRAFSHWHFYCTMSCSKMLPTFFAVKAAECLSFAPESCTAARDTVLALAQQLLSPDVVLGSLIARGGPAAAPPSRQLVPFLSRVVGHANGTVALREERAADPSAPEYTAAVANAESVVIWLLDLLFRDAAERDPGARRFQLFLEAAMPPLAAASVQLSTMMLCSLQSAYPFRGYDEEFLGLWRTRIWGEVGAGGSPCVPPAATEPLTKAEVRRTLEATMEFFTRLDRFCEQPTTEGRSAILSRWLKEYCASTAAQASVAAPVFTVPVPHTTGEASTTAAATEPNSMYTAPARGGASTGVRGSRNSRLSSGIFADLPHPIFNPFKPTLMLKSVRVSDIRVEETSSTRPVWLTFSTYDNADRDAYERYVEARRGAARTTRAGERGVPKEEDADKRAPRACRGTANTATCDSTVAPERICEFLYKRENAERDQLMCVSGRLLQLFLREGIDGARLTNYSVLPLSCDSALIEKADGYILSKLPGTGNSADITTFLNTLGDDARKNFLASAKLFLLMNYIFSIGDRHQGNVMVSFNGAILHIDFGFIFSERTFVEKIAGTTMRVDNQFLAAVAACRRTLRERETEPRQPHQGALVVMPPSRTSAPASVPAAVEYDEFFKEAADWFLALRPHAAEFYELWLYAANRRTLNFAPRDLAVAINCLFDRSASRETSAENFATTMKQSINVCRLKDATHSGVQALKSYSGQVGQKVSEGGYEVVRSLGSLWSSWRGY